MVILLIVFVVLITGTSIDYSIAGGTSTSTGSNVVENFFKAKDACDFWKKFFDFSMQVIAAIAITAVAIGGLYYIISLGRQQSTDVSKKIISGAITGLILGLATWGLFNVISPNLLICKIEVPKLQLAGHIEADRCASAWKKYDSKEECEQKETSKCTSKGVQCTKAQQKKEDDPEKWCCYNPKPGCPIDASSVVSCYGWRHISSRRSRTGWNWHTAIDIWAVRGTPVVAIDDGKVSCHFHENCNTKFARFTDSKGRSYQYFHLASCIDSDTVRKGDEIGVIGAYNEDKCSGGDHLHFGSLPDSEPLKLIPEDCISYYSKTSNCCFGSNCFNAAKCPTNTCYGVDKSIVPVARCFDFDEKKFLDYNVNDPRCDN